MKKRGEESGISEKISINKNKLASFIFIALIVVILLAFVKVFTSFVVSSPAEAIAYILNPDYGKQCASCGYGLFNLCDKTECEKINSNCFFINNQFPIADKCQAGCEADINCDSEVNSYELQQYIKKWQTGHVTNKELMNAIKENKRGK